MLKKIVVCDCLLDISFRIFDEVPPHDGNRFHVTDQFNDIVWNAIFFSKNERFYIDLAAYCVDFYDLSKIIVQLFLLILVKNFVSLINKNVIFTKSTNWGKPKTSFMPLAPF